MTASPATRRRASAKLVAVAAARRLPSRISTTSEDANQGQRPGALQGAKVDTTRTKVSAAIEALAAAQVNVDQNRSVQKSLAKVGPAGIGPAEVRRKEARLTEGGLAEIGPAEVSPAEAGLAEVGLGEMGPAEIRPEEVGPKEAGLAEAGVGKAGLAKVGPAEVSPVEAGLAEVGSRQVDLEEFSPAEMGPALEPGIPALWPLPEDRELFLVGHAFRSLGIDRSATSTLCNHP